MQKIILILLVLASLIQPAGAQEEEPLVDTEPLMEALPPGVTASMGEESLWDGVLALLKGALSGTGPAIRRGLGLCGLLLCVLLLCAMVHMAGGDAASGAVNGAGALGLCGLCLGNFSALISLGARTVQDMTDYGSTLLPALSGAAAIQGGLGTSQALYTGTVLFSTVLMELTARLLVPLVYFYLALAAAQSALGTDILSELREFTGWIISKSMRLLLYLFLAYMSFTGVISGASDAAAVKAAKATISGMVPVVGSMLSDASETLLVSASMLRSTVGILGTLGVLALVLTPFFRIGIQYLLLKATAAIGGTLGLPAHVKLLKHFSQALGYLLGMCGSCALMLLISIVCFLRVAV